MLKRHSYLGLRNRPATDCKQITGIDYAIWVQNSKLSDDELSALLGVSVKYIKRMRQLDWIPGQAVRDRIDRIIMTRR